MLPAIADVVAELAHERDPVRRDTLEQLALSLVGLRLIERELALIRLLVCRAAEATRGSRDGRRDAA